MRTCDWFNISAIPSIGFGLYGFSFALSRVPAMSPLAECLWIIGAIVLAGIGLFSNAKAAQSARENKEQDRLHLNMLEEIRNLLSKPETTLADVKTVVDMLYADTFFPMRRITSPALWDYLSRHNQAHPDADPASSEDNQA
jgi:hypothetical protein